MQLLTNGTKMHLFSISKKKVRNDEQCLQKKIKRKNFAFLTVPVVGF